MLEKILITALHNTYQVYQELGDKGRQLVKIKGPNQIALKADIEMEEAVIDTLRKEKVPIRLISEEHGIVELSDKPKYLGILDGLDGTDAYKKNDKQERYGTMFGIFKGLNPKYSDYLVSGVMEHPTRKLFFASKGKGSFEITSQNRKKIHCSKNTEFTKDTPIYIDKEFDKNRNITLLQDTFLSKLNGFTNISNHISSAVHCVDLASGKVDLVIEATRKKNLEIAVAFGLLTEAGGTMMSVKGENLKNKKYLEFAQDKYLPIISAATEQMAKNLLEYIKK